MDKPTKHILSLSYGKDSLACLEAIKQLGWPLDGIVHADVWATDTIHADLPPMVEFKKKADKIIKERYGIEVFHVCATAKTGGVGGVQTGNLHTNNASIAPITGGQREKQVSGDSLCEKAHGVIPVLKLMSSTQPPKDTYERMFYQIPKRRCSVPQGTIKGFPGVVRAKWCQKLKVNCFLKAPWHKELT